jgi:hypothetical protein
MMVAQTLGVGREENYKWRGVCREENYRWRVVLVVQSIYMQFSVSHQLLLSHK